MNNIPNINADFFQNDETASDSSERCFEEMYKGDSRKWLIRDASSKQPAEPFVSTMKYSYEYPKEMQEERVAVGRRRAILQQKLFEEVAEQIIQERSQPPPVEEYCSTYDGTFQVAGFQPEKKPYGRTPELYEKYPLYSSPSMSYWQFLHSNSNGTRTSLPGLTAILDVKNPFKRNSEFSKPISEVLDSDSL